MDREGMLKSALAGGVLLGVLSALPLVNLVNCLCCAWVIAGGVLAAYLYVKGSPFPVTLGSGLVLGLLAGAIGAIVDTVLSIPLNVVMTNVGMGLSEQTRDMVDMFPNLPPETRDAVLDMLSAGPGTGLFFLLMAGVFKLVVYALIAMLGGALGVALFEKRKTGTQPVVAPPVYPPPPPPEDLPQ
jgi:hypothetical protein